MQPLSGNQRPDLLTSLMNMSFVLRLPAKCILADPLHMSHACHGFWKCDKTPTFCSLLTGAQSLAPARRNDIWTSKSDASMWCFVHFDFDMCFAPQRRALFRHLNFQKWSGPGVFCTFWLRNVVCATTACTFSTSQLPKVVRHWCVLCILTSTCASRHACTFSTSQLPKVVRTWCALHILTSKCASRHNGVIWPDGSAPAALASLLFDPPEPQIIGKTQCFAAFLPFHAYASSFFWLFLFYHLLSSALLFSLPLPSSAFHLSILSEVWPLNFLPSYNYIYICEWEDHVQQLSLHLLLRSLLLGMQAAHVTRVAPVKEAVGLGTAMTAAQRSPLSWWGDHHICASHWMVSHPNKILTILIHWLIYMIRTDQKRTESEYSHAMWCPIKTLTILASCPKNKGRKVPNKHVVFDHICLSCAAAHLWMKKSEPLLGLPQCYTSPTRRVRYPSTHWDPCSQRDHPRNANGGSHCLATGWVSWGNRSLKWHSYRHLPP